MDKLHIPLLAGALLLATCATLAEPGLVVPLAPAPSNAGAMAQATLMPAARGTRIEVFFTAAGQQPTTPLHIYTYLYEGTCASLPAVPAYELNDRVLVRTPRGDLAQTRRGAFTLSHNIALPLAELVDGRFVLALRAAPQDGHALLYCGELRGA
jgi:hypothetical protein